MKWGCNYSDELIKLVREGELPELDYIKAGAFGGCDLEKAFAQRPLLLHGFGWYERLGMDLEKAVIPKTYGSSLEKAVQRMNELIYYYESPHIAIHCLAYPEDERELFGSQEEKESQLYERMKGNILYLKEKLEVPLLIENIDYCPYYDKLGQINNLAYPTRPEVIRRLAEETDIGFLFDLSHARVSAEHLKIDFEKYCQSLPMDRVREVHLSGSGIHPELGRIDVHEELDEEDYAWIEKLWRGNAPEYITLEYGFVHPPAGRITSEEAILRQMRRLREIFR